MATTYDYEKLVERKKKTVSEFTIDSDRSITGKYIVNVKAYFDENPEERIRLGWTKHIHPDRDLFYDKQTHYLVVLPKQVDEFTIVDEYHALPKSEEMLELENGTLTPEMELSSIDEYDSMAKLSLIVLMDAEFNKKI